MDTSCEFLNVCTACAEEMLMVVRTTVYHIPVMTKIDRMIRCESSECSRVQWYFDTWYLYGAEKTINIKEMRLNKVNEMIALVVRKPFLNSD